MHSVWLATTAFRPHLNSSAQLATTVLQAAQAQFLVHRASTLQQCLQFAHFANRPQLRMVELPTTLLVSAPLAPWAMSLLPLLLRVSLVLQAHSALAYPANVELLLYSLLLVLQRWLAQAVNVEFVPCVYIYKYILLGV